MSFEDKLKENFVRGSAELEKRRLALEGQQRKDRERREKERKEAQERKEREAREQENRRRMEEERRMERQREMERQRDEERLRELERKEVGRELFPFSLVCFMVHASMRVYVVLHIVYLTPGLLYISRLFLISFLHLSFCLSLYFFPSLSFTFSPPLSPLLFSVCEQELERQQRVEWERGKKEELGKKKERELEEILKLRAKKKSLEMELEAVVRHAGHTDTHTLTQMCN